MNQPRKFPKYSFSLNKNLILKFYHKILVVFYCIFVFLSPVYAQEAIYSESPQGFVSDFAKIIENDDVLEIKLESYESKTSNEIAIATVQSIGEVSIEEYAVTLFEKWGIGKEDKDNGILLLVALEEKKVRIEVGYGLEGVVPDSVAGSIIRNEITPSFSEGNYSEGIEKAVDALIASIGGEYIEEESEPASNNGRIIFFVILIVVIFFIIIISRFSKGGTGGGSKFRRKSSSINRTGFGKGGGSSSSSGGGSFGGFGGGRSGGGGSSGSW